MDVENKMLMDAVAAINPRFSSGNSVPVDRAWVSYAEWKNLQFALALALAPPEGDTGIPTSAPEGFVLVPVEVQKNAERYEWLRDNQSCSISIEHNYHHLSYENAADALDDPQGYYNECPEEERTLMIEADSIWTIHEYPNTPVGFNTWHGASLDTAIDAAMLAARPEVKP